MAGTENTTENTQTSSEVETDASESTKNETKTNPQAQMPIEQELIALKSKVEENWNLFLRARAETDNIQRRSRVDVENAHKYSTEKFARELLMVVDSLEMGLDASSKIPETEAVKSVREGMNLTFKLLLDIMSKFGAKQTNPIGETFDPAIHEAIQIQASNEVEPNKILIVAQKGFTLYDRLLRPARVIVAKAPENIKVDKQA